MKHNGLHRRITLPLVCLGCLHRMGFAPAQDFTQHCDGFAINTCTSDHRLCCAALQNVQRKAWFGLKHSPFKPSH